MILRALGTLILRSHPDPDFYARLSKRTAPKLGESAAELRARVKTNLQRDYVTKAVAIRICIFAVAAFVVLNLAGGMLGLLGFSNEAQIRQTQSRISQKQEQIMRLEATATTGESNGHF